MWAYENVFYQIYPLGFCDAPFENDGIAKSRILKVNDWIPHIQKLGIDAIYFSPVFESDTHGYNTRDYRKIDTRLGSNADFATVCSNLHKAGIKVVLDGVFNHVGRGFWAFQDVLKNRWDSPYKDWFFVNFDGNSNYNDGLWYEGWEGHFDLVKINLRNEEVISHIFDCIKGWVDEFDIDGLRLDVAYCLDHDFLRRLRSYCDSLKPDFFLVGETLHGDYNQIMNDSMLHSVTNYECYKGLHSSFNSMNMFEINHSLLRQFGSENWTLYKGKHLLSFVDNHDVTRVASILNNEKHLPLIYALMFGMPGIPCVYYGSEWGAKARKEEGDPALRASFPAPEWNDLTTFISKLAAARHQSSALNYGDFRSVVLTNKQCIFERKVEGERVLVAINADEAPYTAYFDAGCATALNLLTGDTHDFSGGSELAPYSAAYWKMND
jgi:glycosidase